MYYSITDTGYIGPTVPSWDNNTCICGDVVYSEPFEHRAPLNYQTVLADDKEREAYFKRIYDFESRQITFKQGLKLKTNYQSPKKINRKLSQYSCVMRGRNKPCRRVAVINQE